MTTPTNMRPDWKRGLPTRAQRTAAGEPSPPVAAPDAAPPSPRAPVAAAVASGLHPDWKRGLRTRPAEPQASAPGAEEPRPSRKRRPLRWILAASTLLLLVPVLALGSLRLAAALRERHAPEALAPATGRFVGTSGGRLFLQDAGRRDGVPVVLVHGTAAWSELWRGTIDHLVRAGFRVVAIDLPPFGFSDRARDGIYTRARQATQIKDVLDALGIGKAILVGHSFGAGATVEAAMRFPERAQGLVIVAGALGLAEPGAAPSADPLARLAPILDRPLLAEALVAATVTNPWTTRPLLGTLLHRKEAATPEIAAILQAPLTRLGSTPEMARWLRRFGKPEPDAQSADIESWRRLPVATRLVWGDRDTVTPLAQAEHLAGLVAGARLAVLRAVGHIPQIEDPFAFRNVLVEALMELGPGLAQPRSLTPPPR